jgi:bifunctional non-homologous end joining protein LigD
MKGAPVVTISHPEKMLFPDDGITKGYLAAYYESVAPLMLPHLLRRPLTMERYPSGIGRKGFWQKDVSKGFPEWLERVDVPKKGGVVHYPLITDLRALMWAANQNMITPHVWVSREPRLFHPDLCVFDLDPGHDDPEALRASALGLRDLLEELGLPSWVKTSGSKGFHIVVPLDGKAKSQEVARFADAVGTELVRRDPDRLTQEFSKADRGGRILVDTGRNGFGATFAAAYAVRAKPGAPVSAPCTWAEIERSLVNPQSFTVRNLPDRIRAVGDLWADLEHTPQAFRRAAEALRRLRGDAKS